MTTPPGGGSEPRDEAHAAQLRLHIPREKKAAYVREARRRGIRLRDWVLQTLDTEIEESKGNV